jgi:membrane protein implicated in regulation of membrane protease activity
MIHKSCILYLIISILIVGALVVGFLLMSFIMLPFIALIAIAALIYYLVSKRGRKGKKVPSEEQIETVDRSNYNVFDAEENK